nr:immunoglobulin heavy chain junction region [Macaca mulatta]MOX67146.1 immunoglobulin heavy chain junction region [Macaca mulatta]
CVTGRRQLDLDYW